MGKFDAYSDPPCRRIPPCECCGMQPFDCECPECPVCGVAGDPKCYRSESHCLEFTSEQLAGQEALKATMEADAEIEPDFGDYDPDTEFPEPFNPENEQPPEFRGKFLGRYRRRMYELTLSECPDCRGSGWNPRGHGHGYNDVCDSCGGQGKEPNDLWYASTFRKHLKTIISFLIGRRH